MWMPGYKGIKVNEKAGIFAKEKIFVDTFRNVIYLLTTDDNEITIHGDILKGNEIE